MATIKCKACGRTYNYRSSELCPKCGAFNRPPRRMRVGFDSSGGVELQTEREFARNARAAGPDDVCFEEQARKVRDTLVENDIVDSKTLDALGEQLNKWGSRMEKWWAENSGVNRHTAKDSPLRDRKKGKSSGGKAVAIVAAVSILVSLLGTIMESCESNLTHIVPEPDVSIATEAVAPYDRYWSAEDRIMILDTYAVSEEIPMGEVFEWQDVKMWLGGWELSGGSSDNFMVVSVNSGDAFPVERLNDCFLLWVDWDGTEWVYNPTKFQNGALIFNDLHTDTMPEDALCWVLFNDYDENDNWIGTTAVSLVEHETYWSDATQDFASVEVWTEEDKKEMLTNYGVTEVVNMSTTFDWEGMKLWVDGYRRYDIDDSTMTLSLNSDKPLSTTSLERCFLVWAPDPNMSWTYYPESYQDGTLTFTGLYDPLHEGIKLWLVCEHYDMYGFRSNATAVELH